jgi:glycosyltransferase involved in cell wall biosynthesis
VNGWICQPDDAPGIARLMHEVVSKSMGQAARATAERFGIDAMARQLVDLYSSLKKRG